MATKKQGFAVWLTGPPSSGKSTLANLLAGQLNKLRVRVKILDSDELRKILTPKPTYTLKERDWFYKVLAYIGSLLTEAGVNVVFAATANKRSYRTKARKLIKNFLEVYVQCPLETCIKRDTKGLYAKAKTGQTATMPGLQDDYEIPKKPEVIVKTNRQSPKECVQKIMNELKRLPLVKVELS
jgi:adenylylsulfate kinase